MKTAPQITAPLIIHQSRLLNKHNRPLLPWKGQKPTWDSDAVVKNRSSPVCSAQRRQFTGRKLLSTYEPNPGVHKPPRTYICIYTQRWKAYIYTCIGTNVCLYILWAGENRPFCNLNLLIQQGSHLASLYLQEKYQWVSLKTDKRELPAILERHKFDVIPGTQRNPRVHLKDHGKTRLLHWKPRLLGSGPSPPHRTLGPKKTPASPTSFTL